MSKIPDAGAAGDAKTYATSVDYMPDEDAAEMADDATYAPPPVELLPPPAAAIVVEVADAMYVDAAYAMLPALFAMAVAIGNTAVAIVKNEWAEPAIIWGALSARSGTNKSAPARLVLKPLKTLNTRLIREYETASAAYETALAEHEAASRKRGKNADAEPPAPPAPPVMRRILVDDTTIERFAPILRDNPRGVGIFRDELGAWIGAMDRYASNGGGELGKWLSMHTGESLTVDRGGTSGRGVVVHVPIAGASVYGTIQPGVLRRSMTGERTASGLFARLLIASPPWRPKRATDAEIRPATIDAWCDLLGTLGNAEMTVDAESGESTPRAIGLSREARRDFFRWSDAHNATAEAESENVAAAVGKLEAYAVRFALIFALSDGAGQIGVGHVARGCGLADWFRRESSRVYTMADEGASDADRRDLLEWLARRPEGVTARDLATSGPRRLRGKRDVAEAELKALAARGHGTYAYPPAGPGRPTLRFLHRIGIAGIGIKTSAGGTVNRGIDSASTASAEARKMEDITSAKVLSGAFGLPKQVG